jgi:hypothetical protein
LGAIVSRPICYFVVKESQLPPQQLYWGPG